MKTPFQQQVQRQQQLRRQQGGYWWMKQQQGARRAGEPAARLGQPAAGPSVRPVHRPVPDLGYGAEPSRARRHPVLATLFFLVGLLATAWAGLLTFGFLQIEVVAPDGIALLGALAVILIGFVLVCRWAGRIWRGSG